MLLKNKTAIITGSNRGIGKSMLNIFSEHGANIIACVRKADKDFINEISRLQKKYDNQISYKNLNFENEQECLETGKQISLEFSEIDILINNAGAIQTSLFQMTPIKKFKEIFQINYFSQIVFTQQIIKKMIKNKKGSIIYISSTSGIDSNEGRGAYSDTKAAIISKSKTLSKELGRYNIRVNCIAPGLTNTRMMTENTSEDNIKKVIENLSLKRFAETNEIANVALFLSSDLSTYLTGQTIRVDGGM